MISSRLAQMNVTPLLTFEELGLDRRATVEEASIALAQAAEAQIVRWTQFPALGFRRSGIRGAVCPGSEVRRVLLADLRRPELGRIQPKQLQRVGSAAQTDRLGAASFG